VIAELDRPAVLRGTITALLAVVPGVVVNVLGHSHKLGAVSLIGFLVIIFGFAIGGFVAAKLSPTLPLQHAAAAAGLAFLAVQAVAVVSLLVRGRSVNVVGIVVSLLLSACAGVIGGMVAVREPRPGGGG
jgi:hypothetical protein